jgi:threonyl-tRNA synthetase
MRNALAFMSSVYGIFGFEFNLELSTRPEKFVGAIEVWDQAEKVPPAIPSMN